MAQLATLWTGLTIILLLLGSGAQAFETKARAALVIDHDTRAVLFEREADAALPPASMSKLMTLYMLFEALSDGRVTLSDTFRVSQKAYEMGGSRMFLELGAEVSVEDLIHGIIVQSGNDACVVVAEGLAGTEAEFAARMNRRASEIGLSNSHFVNSTGWPHPDHKMSARDLVTLTTRLVDKFPTYYPYFGQPEFTWNGITQKNRNPLLALNMGADGLKTGHTEEAGYGLVGSVVRDGRRVSFVLSGLTSERERLEEADQVVNWAFRDFDVTTIFPAGAQVLEADVWLGAAQKVTLVTAAPVRIVVPKAARDAVTAAVVYAGPIDAPVAAGQAVAELVVTVPDLGEQRFALVAQDAVARGGLIVRYKTAAQMLTARVMASVLGAGD